MWKVIFSYSKRPYYLPREFPYVIVCTVYVPDRTVAKEAAIEIQQALQLIEANAPEAISA